MQRDEPGSVHLSVSNRRLSSQIDVFLIFMSSVEWKI